MLQSYLNWCVKQQVNTHWKRSASTWQTGHFEFNFAVDHTKVNINYHVK